MSELEATLEALGLREYLSRLIEHGFDTWDNLTCITEADMATLGIKLGHRRKLQREAARQLGHPPNKPLFDMPAAASQMRGKYTIENGRSNSGHLERSCKQRILRSPPVLSRPSDTGYTAYAKFLCQDPKVSNLSVAQVTNFVEKRWSSLSEELKATWDEAASQKDIHDSHLAHHQTEACCACGGCSKLRKLQEDQDDDQVQYNNRSSEIYRGGPAPFEAHYQCHPKLAQGISTFSVATTHTSIGSEVSLSQYTSSPATSTCGGNKVELDSSLVKSIWKIISQEHASYPAVSPAKFSQDDLLSYTGQHPRRSNSLHIRTINPFNFQQRSTIWPLMDSFLRNVNSVYYFISPDDLQNNLESTLDTTLETPSLTMSVVCVCLALGCQTYHADATDMAIMWYENGRRYLDDRDWCLEPVVMQILALISMFHMAERPATSSHYLDAAIRIGEANILRKTTEQARESWVMKWLNIWNTIQTMHRILLLGCGMDGSILQISQIPIHCAATPGYNTRTQLSVAAAAFGELSNTLGSVQQQIGQSNILPLWIGNPFVQKLKIWLHSLPDELSFLKIHGVGRWDPAVIKNFFLEASDARKVELLHLYSLYFGVVGLLTGSSLQQVVAVNTEQPYSALSEVESYACECLNSATQLIDLCTAFSLVTFFPIYAWLPQCVLFTSSLTCTLGIIWQRQVLDRDASASQELLKRSYSGIHNALDIFKHCGIKNEQAQRHYNVLRQLFGWLESEKYDRRQFATLASRLTNLPQLRPQNNHDSRV